MTALRCAVHRRRLPSRLDHGGRHAATCLRCQATEARYRMLLRGLRELRSDEETAPESLLADVMGQVAGDAEPARAHGRSTVVAIAGGTAVAIAAAAAIAGIRHRRAA